MRYPEEVLSPIVAFANLRKVSGAEVAVKCDNGVTTFVEFLGYALWMQCPQVGVVWMSQRESNWIVRHLMLILSFDNTPIWLLSPRSLTLLLLPLGMLLLLLHLRSLIRQADLVVRLRLDARLVPHVVIFDWIAFGVLVEDGPLEVGQWLDRLDLALSVGSLGELDVVSDFAFGVVEDVVLRLAVLAVTLFAEASALFSRSLATSYFVSCSAF